jgi:cobalt-precorrin 5A hydrolase
MDTAVLALCSEAARVGMRICEALPGAGLHIHESVTARIDAPRFERVIERTAELVGGADGFVFVMPTGVAVRAIAPHVRDKHTDPAVVAVDAGGRWAVSLLSGHEGGANELTMRVANALGAEPVISTTTESEKTLIAGLGCRRGIERGTILDAIDHALAQAGAKREDLRCLATAAIKRDEAGLLEAAGVIGVPLRIIPDEELKTWGKAFAPSEIAQQRLGLPAVAEPCAMLAGRRTRLALSKIAHNGVTVALAREDCTWSASAPEA